MKRVAFAAVAVAAAFGVGWVAKPSDGNNGNPPAYGARIATLEQDVKNLTTTEMELYDACVPKNTGGGVTQCDNPNTFDTKVPYARYFMACKEHHILARCLESLTR